MFIMSMILLNKLKIKETGSSVQKLVTLKNVYKPSEPEGIDVIKNIDVGLSFNGVCLAY